MLIPNSRLKSNSTNIVTHAYQLCACCIILAVIFFSEFYSRIYGPPTGKTKANKDISEFTRNDCALQNMSCTLRLSTPEQICKATNIHPETTQQKRANEFGVLGLSSLLFATCFILSAPSPCLPAICEWPPVRAWRSVALGQCHDHQCELMINHSANCWLIMVDLYFDKPLYIVDGKSPAI